MKGRTMNPLIQLQRATPVFVIALACICGLVPKTQAVSPPPDGGYPGANTAEGQNALLTRTTGGYNTAGWLLLLLSDTTHDVICIAHPGSASNNSCFIGHIRGVTTGGGDAIPVLIDSSGQLGTASSSRRYKTDIKPIESASESILGLKPVSFRYKVHKDSTPHFGLIAEEVAQVNPDLVIYDPDGEPYSVRYDAVNAMLLNEFLKEHQTVQELKSNAAWQETTIAELKSTIAQQQKGIEALTAGLQKVRAQLEVSKAAPQTVLNNQ
jgi:uncharacterized coiled-coil protein SlyX